MTDVRRFFIFFYFFILTSAFKFITKGNACTSYNIQAAHVGAQCKRVLLGAAVTQMDTFVTARRAVPSRTVNFTIWQ